MTIAHNLSNLPLRPSSLSRLEQRGFVSTAEIEASKRNGGIANLAAELNLSLAEAASIVREVESAIQSVTGSDTHQSRKTATALSILKRTKTTERTIVTFSKAIDNLLGGGFSKSEVTEIVGLPGTGKTQLAMQLCVDARLPTSFGGVAGESVYIDTEGSFSPERCYTMAKVMMSA
jgi:RAD51-like protein 2